MGRGAGRNTAAAVEADTTWMLDAACADVTDVDFFPERGGSSGPAKDVCAGCPAVGPCLEYALVNVIRFGVWGGTSERERRRIRVARAKAAANG